MFSYSSVGLIQVFIKRNSGNGKAKMERVNETKTRCLQLLKRLSIGRVA